jgi:hypothetical protein
MKKLHIAPYCIALAVGNCVLPELLAQLGQIMAWVYHGALGGEQALAGCTRLALALPPWFYVFTVLSLLALVGLFIRRISLALMVHWLLAVCLLECVALFFFACGMCISLAPLHEKVRG